MRHLTCDVAIIGAGTAGLAAREAAAAEGARVLLVDDGPGGTTCARTGCMPSKLIIAAAGAAHAAAGVGLFGLRLDGRVVIDGPAVMARVRRERDRFVGGVLASVGRIPEAERLHGRARFVGATTLAVGDDVRVEARAVVVATGSRPAIPPAFRDLGEAVLTSESVFELPDLPESLAVIGAGPLGIELAQAFARLGAAVTVFDEGGHVGGLSDPDVAASALALLSREMPIELGAEVRATRAGEGVEIAWSRGGREAGTQRFRKVLVAAGRPPNLDGLDLDRAGLALDRHGAPDIDPATMRAGGSAVFFAGDADHARPVLHEASDEGRIAGRNAARHPRIEPSPRMAPLAVTYTDPEIAVVGGGWRGLAARDPARGDVDLSDSGRARVMGRNAGWLRVYADREGGTLLGAEMIGPEAEHLAHLLAWAVQRRLTADDVLALPFYHPTLEESLRAALRKLCGELRTRPEWRADAMEYGPGS